MSGVNWNGLLKWSMEYQSEAPVDGRTRTVTPMDPERMAFLKNAINEALKNMKDPHAMLKEAMDVLKDLSDIEACMAALEIVDNLMVDYPEMARDLHKVEAAGRLLDIGKTFDKPEHILIPRQALRILSGALQNNPGLQKAIHELHGVKILCSVLQRISREMTALERTKDADPILLNNYHLLRSAAMTCLSSSVRHYPETEALFIKKRGILWVAYGLRQTKDSKLVSTCAMLTSHMITSKSLSTEMLCSDESGNVMKEVVTNLRKFDPESGPQVGELLVDILVALVERRPSKRGLGLPSDVVAELKIALLELDGKLEIYNSSDTEDPFDYELCRKRIANIVDHCGN